MSLNPVSSQIIMVDYLVYVIGHSIANIKSLHHRWQTLSRNQTEFRVFFHCFNVPDGTIDSFLESQAFEDFQNAPKPHLTLILIGGNNIYKDTVIKEL